MAAITAGVVVAGAGLYGAKKQADAAKSASKTQAQGVANAQEASRLAAERALPLIEQGFTQSRGAITTGADQARQNLLAGNEAAIGSLGQGYDAARADLNTGFNQAQQTFQPTAQQGAGASQLQAALSGAPGPEAQATALQNYQQSPGQEFLAGQQEKSLLRNATALGGGLSASPRVMSALQEQAFGRAQTDFDNQFNRLGSIASRGDAANQNIGMLQSNLAQLLSGLSTGKGAGIAGLQTENSANLANLNTSTAAQLAQALQAQGTTSANTLIGQGSEQAQLAQNLGQAQSGAAMYNAQNASPLLQGLQQGIGAYAGMGGNFVGLLSGGQTGNTQSGYTGNAYKNWLAGQR